MIQLVYVQKWVLRWRYWIMWKNDCMCIYDNLTGLLASVLYHVTCASSIYEALRLSDQLSNHKFTDSNCIHLQYEISEVKYKERDAFMVFFFILSKKKIVLFSCQYCYRFAITWWISWWFCEIPTYTSSFFSFHSEITLSTLLQNSILHLIFRF